MRKITIAGNWKLNKTPSETVALIEALKSEVKDVSTVNMIVCPPFTSLTEAAKILKGINIALGAQNVYWEDAGAFTGEVSAPMLKDAGVSYVIIGHSERRQYFGETNDTVNKRTKKALEHGLSAIVCVGETLEDREAGKTFDVVKDHVTGSLAGLSNDNMTKVIIAYEPVWAIGTGKTATPEQAQEVHQYIREVLKDMFNDDVANNTIIQYGGSMKPENAAELLGQPDIDGGLIGGASLKADAFAAIIKAKA